MHLYHMTFWANRNSSHYHEVEQPCAQGQRQNTKRNSILFVSKLSCKGSLRAVLYVFCYLENQFYVVQTAPKFVYTLRSLLSTSQHRFHWLSQCLCKHFTIWRMTRNLFQNIIGNVASSYQVNLAIEIPNVTENDINLHFFTCQRWVSAMLI